MERVVEAYQVYECDTLENENITLLMNRCKYLRQLPDLPGDRHKLRCHLSNFVLRKPLLTEVSRAYNTLNQQNNKPEFVRQNDQNHCQLH